MTPSGGTGGVVGIGGTGTGGSGVSGGAPGVGGAGTGGSGTGGSAVTGGAPGSGGGVGTGGAPAGGAPSSGGAAAGGSGSGGGGAVGPGPSNIPPAPVEANVPKPAGTPGDVTIIDWAGFPAAVTYSLDDNDGSQLTYYDQMHELGGRYTYYLVSEWGMTDPKWKTILADGNEIGTHTTNHSCGASQIDGGIAAIEAEFGVRPTTMAAPDGNNACQSPAMGRVFINRDVDPATPVKPLDNSNPFALNCYIPSGNQAADAYNANINTAVSQNGWIIYVIHGISPGTNHSFQPVSWEGLKGAIEYAKAQDVWIDTMENVGAYWLGQKAFAAATSQAAGDSTTWTWTLPDNFPPGKYLRATVAGGTLTQGGTPLTWDPHGYYEIALDELSVTLGP